jgi:hypothetical protein
MVLALNRLQLFDGDTAKLRDYFGLKLEEATVAYYAKQGYFSPENPHDLHIQLSTMQCCELWNWSPVRDLSHARDWLTY